MPSGGSSLSSGTKSPSSLCSGLGLSPRRGAVHVQTKECAAPARTSRGSSSPAPRACCRAQRSLPDHSQPAGGTPARGNSQRWRASSRERPARHACSERLRRGKRSRSVTGSCTNTFATEPKCFMFAHETSRLIQHSRRATFRAVGVSGTLQVLDTGERSCGACTWGAGRVGVSM